MSNQFFKKAAGKLFGSLFNSTVNTDKKEEKQMSQLPDFNSLQRMKKAGLPSFDELQKAKAKPPLVEGVKTSEKSVALPSFEELAKAQKGGKKDSKAKKVKGANKRAILAKTLDIFKQAAGNTGHAYFYRYLRLHDMKNDGLPGPKGGACILVNMLNDNEFMFSFSVCSELDMFIKDESRRICQERFLKSYNVKLSRRDRSASCYENIERAISNYFLFISKDPQKKAAFSQTEPVMQVMSPMVSTAQLKLLAKFIRNLYYPEA